MSDPIIVIKGLKNQLGGNWVHEDVNLTVNRGEILAIIGGSGSGKTTIFRTLLMLHQPTAGRIEVLGKNISKLDDLEANQLRQHWGVLFQHSALFSSMSVLDNIIFPIKEFTELKPTIMEELAMLKLSLVGLPKDAAYKFPYELSGGMQRRAAMARALAMDPEILFLDEPTTGLDPQGARKFDKLIYFLKEVLNLTIVMISHDLESIKHADRIAFIGEGKILEVAPFDKLIKNKHPMIADYFNKT